MTDPRIPKQFPGRSGYTDQQLRYALRRVIEQSRYESPSMSIYRDEKPDHYPDASTIAERFGSWGEAKDEIRENLE